jgi:hypothetical protein
MKKKVFGILICIGLVLTVLPVSGVIGYDAGYYLQTLTGNNRTPLTNSKNMLESGRNDNLPPYQPHNESPINGSIDVYLDMDLSWTGGDPDGDPVTYDVYFGNISSPPQVSSNQSNTTYEPGIMNYNTTYYWKIMAWDNNSAFNESPLWEFTTGMNHPPYQPSNPNPSNSSTSININIDLSWTGGDPDGDPVTYDVYFGTNSTPPEVVSNQTATTYAPGTMNYNTTYYWKIIAWDNHSVFNESPMWEFTTESEPENNPPYEPSNPNPEDGTNDVQPDATLSWTGGDPDGDPVTYDLYFGTTSPPEKIQSNQTGTTYDPELEYSQTYYWHIVAWDDSGESTEGDIWEFTTIEQQDLVIEITQPVENYFYIRNVQLFGLNNRTFIYGPITIIANVTSGAEIDRVDFYINEIFMGTDNEAPYEYNWSQILSFKKTIKVIVYDTEGNNATDELVVFKWRLHPVLLMAGIAFVLNPNTKLIRSVRGDTVVRGFIFNPKREGKTLTFRAIRLHYTKVKLLSTESGVVVGKKCSITTNSPDIQFSIGPFGKVSWIYCIYKGTDLEQPGFLQPRERNEQPGFLQPKQQDNS